MENVKFDQLLTYAIKRLSRPKFKHENIQLQDPLAFQSFEEDPDLTPTKGFDINQYDPCVVQTETERRDQMTNLGSNRNDISFDGLPSDSTLSYNTAFGKIYAGERLKVLITLMNISDVHQLGSVRLVIKLTCRTAKKPERTLVEENIPTMVQREVRNYPIEFKIESPGLYV
jgi:hypothetical protein